MNVGLIGVPGSGKTTIARALIAQFPEEGWTDFRFGKVRGEYHVDSKFLVLGLYREQGLFAGTDRLSMAVMPDALKLAARIEGDKRFRAVFWEGDRLATSAFIAAIGGQVFRVSASAELVRERRKDRGSNQNESWINGRESKVNRLAVEFGLEDLNNETAADIGINAEIVLGKLNLQ